MTYDPTNKIPPFPTRAKDLEPAFQRFDTLVTPQRLKDEYLFGIPLKSRLTGQEMKDETLKSFIVRAISIVEHDTRISVSPVEYQERFDYTIKDYYSYNFIQLNHWPVLQVVSFKAKFPNSIDFIQYPNDWVAVYNESGTFQITPTTGFLTTFFLTNDATYIPLVLNARAEWPQLWELTYTAGFDNDKLPAIVNDLIGHIAALRAMELMSSVLFPYMGYGLGIDGASQSISTAGPQFFSERIASSKETILDLTDKVKRYYNRKLLLGVL